MSIIDTVYLGGPSNGIPRIREAAAKLTAAGFEITEPWWERVEEAARRGWRHDAEVPVDYMRESALRNEQAIVRSGFSVFLCKSEGGLSSGVAYELGYARMLQAAVFVETGHVNATPLVLIVGDPRGHVGIWTGLDDGTVCLVTDLDAALMRMRARRALLEAAS